MKKTTKKMMIAVCSFLCVCSLGITAGTLMETNPTVQANAASEPTVAFDSIDATQNNNNWSGQSSWKAVYVNFTGGTLEGDNYGTVPEGVSYTATGTQPTAFYVWRSGNQLQFLFEEFSALADGSTLTIAEGTELYGQTFPEVNLKVENGVWVYVEPTPDPEPTTATFVGIDENQNNVQWGTGEFIGVFLNFSEEFTEHSDLVSTITYTPAGGTETPFDFTWATFGGLGSANQLQLIISGLTPIADGAVLHIPEGTVVGGLTLSEVTLYVVDSKWQEEKPETPEESETTTANFVGIAADVQDDGRGRAVLALEFDQPMNASGVKADLDPATVSTNTYNITLNGNTVGVKNAEGCILPRNRAYTTTTSDNVLELYFIGYGTAGTQFATGVTSPFASGTVLKIGEGTVVNGYVLPELTFYFNATTKLWQTEVIEVETPDPEPTEPTLLTFKEITWNRIGFNEYADKHVVLLQYTNDRYAISNDALDLTDTLGEAITIGGTKISEMTDGLIKSHPDYGACFLLIQYDDSYATHGAALEIAQTTVGNAIIPEFTLYMNSTTNLWQESEPEVLPETTEATIVSISGEWNNKQNPFADNRYLSVFNFDVELSATALTDNNSYSQYFALNGVACDITTNPVILSCGANGTALNVAYLKTSIPTFSETVTQVKFELTQEISYGDVVIQPFTLYLNEANKWQTEEYTYVAPTEVTFEGISEWNNHTVFYNDNGRLYTVLQFSETLYADVEIGQTLLAAVKNSVKLNGETIDVAMTAGSEGGFGLQILATDIPTLSADCSQVILTIDEGTVVGNYILPEVTLYLNKANKWQTEEYTYVAPTEVTFEGISEWNNHTVFYNDNGRLYTVLQFSETLYADVEIGQTLLAAVKNSVKLNGETIDVAMTAGSEGGFGIQILATDIPTLSADCSQVILTIDEGTVVGNYILPEVTLYLNAANRWQTEEYTYITPTEVTFEGINWNNGTPFDNGHYLTSLKFSQELYGADDLTADTLTYNNGSALLNAIAKNIKINGVNGIDLGLKFHGDSSGDLNFQISIEKLLELSEESSRIILTIDEGTVVGNYIIPSIRLYLTDANKWELIDETDKTAPEITYNGATEINTSAGKPFVIDISAFDNEDNAVCEIYYDWSAGALDEQGKLVKGTHTCTITTIDRAGNEAKLVLTVNVGDMDTTKPVITAPDSMTVFEGVIPEIEYSAMDDLDGEIICQVSWSDGALDENGKLVLGTHTMTLTATDLTGNTETKVVTVVVTSIPDDVLPPVEDTEPENPPAETPDEPSTGDDSNSGGDSSATDTEKTGCKSSVEGSAIMIFFVMIAGVAIVHFVKRKEA